MTMIVEDHAEESKSEGSVIQFAELDPQTNEI